MTRSKKGTVSIETFKDNLRLRWTHRTLRYCLSVGFPNDSKGMLRAKGMASQIELDMIAGYFDPTLEKYGKVIRNFVSDKIQSKSLSPIVTLSTLVEAYDEWIRLKPESEVISYHKWTRSYLIKNKCEWESLCQGFLRDIVSSQYSWKFRKAIVLKFLCALDEDNYGELRKKFQLLKYPGSDIGKKKHKTRQPFTDDEIARILNYAQEFYPQYQLMIELWILTGLRNGEIFGLRPKDFSLDFTKIIIGESLIRNQIGGGKTRKGTKTDNIRTLKLRGSICDRLIEHCRNLPKTSLIFKSPTGYPIHDGNFRRRVWTKILKALGMAYRVPYACRHTMASRALESGLNPVAVASLLGHSSPTLVLERYGHVITSDVLPQLPDR